MAEFFVTVDIETDAQTMADDAVAALSAKWDGWTPNEGDPEVIQIETLAPMAANSAETAARVPPAIFRAYGTKLVGRAYAAGTPAVTTVTFTMVDTVGQRTIFAEDELDIDGWAFRVDADVVIPDGAAAAAAVPVHSVDLTAAANGFAGAVVAPVTSWSFVQGIAVDAPTSGGSDPENDSDYENNLSRDLLLQAKTLVTLRDFELWALSFAGVGRAVAVHTGDRHVDVVLTAKDGTVLSTPIKDAIVADFAQYRLVNTIVTLQDPTYTHIAVAYTVKALPGYDFVDLKARVNEMLAGLLSPTDYGASKFGEAAGSTPGWVYDSVVRANALIDRIGDVQGVNYVVSVAITGDAGAASGSDWTMAGTYALPLPGTMTGTVT